MTDDERETQREVLSKISDALAGVPIINCIEVCATFQSFLICAVSDSKYDALTLQKEIHEKTAQTIHEKYDAYHAQWVDKTGVQ